MVETKIYSALIGNSALAQKVNTRIYPVVLPQGCTLPAVTYQRTYTNKINHLQGYSGLENPHIGVFIWCNNYDEAKTITALIHTAMRTASTFKALMISDIDFYEPELQVYGVSMDFSCWDTE